MTAARFLVSLAFTAFAVGLVPAAGAQTTAPTEGFAALSPAQQRATLELFAPLITENCGNFRAITQINKTFVAMSENKPCVAKTLEDSAMFRYVLDDTIARCAAHSRDLIVNSTTRTIRVRLTAEDMAGFASAALTPIVAVNCR